jgi:uncharacterized coiled-coil protein SlyX
MDAERLQNLEVRLHEQAEATRATNKLISQLFSMMRTRNINDNITTPPPHWSPSPRLLHPLGGVFYIPLS